MTFIESPRRRFRHRRVATGRGRRVVVRAARRMGVMSAADAGRSRDAAYKMMTLGLALVFLPVAFVVAGRRAAHVGCRWALAFRFPAERLAGLTAETRAALEAARSRALWRHGELIGVTSGHRPAERQARIFADAIRREGSLEAARLRALPPGESRHVAGTAVDVRPVEGARWLERYGARYGLYRIYENEWWHFEYRPGGRPVLLPHPGVTRRPARSTVYRSNRVLTNAT
ncbi:D-alanyl-D-alanine carboxypeptidase family protein [Winogradskya consettensis]|uniref:D-alanyl-D-alanine carboxypeptidase family protein n=1 Tax=Winogradskya consettensis TaxID=113560 RepID=UPI001BB348DD|nr:D-alanyl-D-alanine carboxypeptidase family protein [Actinoplanes consettensis]